MVEIGMRNRLLSIAAVAAFVDSRIYPLEAPPATGDLGTRIIYRHVSTKAHYTLAGPCALKFVRLQLDCVGSGTTPYLVAKQLAEAVKKKGILDGYVGTWTGAANIPTILHCRLMDEKDHYVPPKDPTTERGQGWVSLDFGFWFNDLNLV